VCYVHELPSSLAVVLKAMGDGVTIVVTSRTGALSQYVPS